MRSLTLTAITLAVMLSGCSRSDGGLPPGVSATPTQVTDAAPIEAADSGLAAAEKAWTDAALDDYQFTYTEICFCDPKPPVVIIVKDDAVDSAFYVHNSEYLSAAEAADLPTIDTLFQKIKDASEEEDAAGEKAEVVATYDDTRGYPVDVLIDPSKQFVDEEFGFEVRDFQ